jgi:hypothetical protein
MIASSLLNFRRCCALILEGPSARLWAAQYIALLADSVGTCLLGFVWASLIAGSE